MLAVKEHMMSCHALLNRRHFFLLLPVLIPLKMYFKSYFKIRLIAGKTNTIIQPVKDKLTAYLPSWSTLVPCIHCSPLRPRLSCTVKKSMYSVEYLQNAFSKPAGHPVFSVTMLKHKFLFLCSVMSFDDPENRRQLWRTNRFVAVRALTNIFND